jgi:hypothetical protein
MSIVFPGDDFYPTTESGDKSQECFLCGENFDPSDGEPVVYWRGGGTNIHFHGGCAGSFALRFARDAWEVERDADDGKFPLTRR